MAKWTIQSLIDDNGTLDVWCHAPLCGHHQRLDLIKLRDRLGPDHGAMHDDLAHKFRCSKCGGKQVGLIYTPDRDKIDRDRMAGRNLYAKAKGS